MQPIEPEDEMITNDKLFIGGTWARPSNPRLFAVASPHDQTVLGRAAQALPGEIDEAVATARAAFDDGPWPHTPPAARIAIVRRLTALREDRAEEIARLTAAESGAALRSTRRGQVELGRQAASFLQAAETYDWEHSASRSVDRHTPVGVVAAITSWHSPFPAALARLVPALLTGNTVVLKVAPESSLSMNLLAGLLTEAGVPEGVVSVLPAGRATSEYLVRHPDVDQVAFTGSARVGRRVAALAVERGKRVSLEPAGGLTTALLPDADLAEAVRALAAGAAQTRVLVPRRRYAESLAALAGMVESLPVGDPLDERTVVGPMPRPDLQQRVRDHIDLGTSEGARVLVGGSHVPDGLDRGNYVAPTLFADADHRMRLVREGVCGPILTVLAYEDEHDLVRIANDSVPGFSAGVWSADEQHATDVARRLRTATVTINGAPVPFGGFRSGGPAGLTEYTAHQTLTRAA
ncbi:aldehyde dehydrogenase family protein [Actinoplanes sp. NPDC024001]|uniref:aldehyde dehydrogenase family protein n=1 Tax=Actinoplanes sp. NPDC024001 TaxID=3154598 RepID=UPI00340283DD